MKSLTLTAQIENSVNVRLTWSNSGYNTLSYKIYRSNSSSGPWTLITTTTINARSYLDKNLQSGNFYYKVTLSGNNVKKQTIEDATSNIASVGVSNDTLHYISLNLGGGDTTVDQGYNPFVGPSLPL